MKNKLLKKGDIVLIIASVFLCTALFLCVNVLNKDYGELVQIEVGGDIKAVLPLDNDASYEIKNEDKTTNVVEIKDGFVYVSYADCKDQICAKHRKINKVNESIICLPNKAVITVVSANGADGGELDGVV